MVERDAVPSLTAALRQRQQQIDQALVRFLQCPEGSPPVLEEAMRYCVLGGGKRFRPLLCVGACEAVGGPWRRAVSIACALELIHTYSLVHDDLPAMDNADERRGKPSCHRQYGEGNAILVGDALLTLAFEVLGRNGIPNALAVIRVIGKACGTAGLIGGQVLDLQAIGRTHPATVQTLQDIAQRKTSALLTAGVVAGALAGGATPAQVRGLERYGRDLGLAFQLIDDLHDGEGMAQVMGRPSARTEAERLIARAAKTLEPFGGRAAVLRDLAGWLASTIDHR